MVSLSKPSINLIFGHNMSFTSLSNLFWITLADLYGHLYVNGLAGIPETEQIAFRTAHSDIYHEAGGVTRITINDCLL